MKKVILLIVMVLAIIPLKAEEHEDDSLKIIPVCIDFFNPAIETVENTFNFMKCAIAYEFVSSYQESIPLCFSGILTTSAIVAYEKNLRKYLKKENLLPVMNNCIDYSGSLIRNTIYGSSTCCMYTIDPKLYVKCPDRGMIRN